MKILVIANYPREGYQFAGIFNERCVEIFKECCDRVEVMAHRPYLPRLFSLVPLVPWWKTWRVSRYEVRNGVSIHRPAYLQLPGVGSAFWVDRGAFLSCRRTAHELHRRVRFDAIVSFDLIGSGGLAWRLAYDLGIPGSGWATGGDLHRHAGTAFGRVALRALEHLNLIFYQSHELLEIAARLLGKTPDMMPKNKHVVLSRGIPEPPSLPRKETRHRVRSALGIRDDQILVLSIGGIWREKGVFELHEAISLAARQDPRLTCVLVGSLPGFDETTALQKNLRRDPDNGDRMRLLPACSPDTVWEYLCAADIFAFTSHNEGMPNSLLEAMVMGVPAIAFAIPPVLELEAGRGGLVLVPAFNAALFSQAILRLAASSQDRLRIGKIGKTEVLNRFMVRRNMAEALSRLAQVVESHKNGKPT